jgi:hypothetical protein
MRPEPSKGHGLGLSSQDRRWLVLSSQAESRSRKAKRPIGCPIGLALRGAAGAIRGSRPAGQGAQFVVTETSSRTNEVASEESSVPVNFSVTDLPMNELTLIVLST